MGSHASKDSHSEASSSSHGHDLNGGLDSGKSTTTTTIKADDAKPLDEKTTDVQAIPSHPPPPYGEANGSAASSSATLVSNPVFSPLQQSSSYASEIPVSTHRYSNVLVRGLKNTLAFLKRLILIIILGPYRAYQLAHNDSKDRVAVAAQAHVRAVPVESTTTSVYTNGLADETSSKNEKDTQSVRTLTNEKETEEVVTEDQAAVRAAREAKQDVQATVTRPRASSRLLPNPNPVDPMLAHDRNAKALEQATAEAEAKALRHKQQQQQGRPAVVSRGPNSSLIHHSPKVLVLDLDETLIHSTSRSPTWGALADKSKTRLAVTTGGSLLGLEGLGGVLGLRGQVGVRPHQVEVVLDGRSIIYHVYKRPHVDTFLRKVASWYHVVVFTASVQEYADPVIDWLDQGRGLISARLFRESCTYRSGSYYKNLSLVDADLSRVCLVDNSPASYQINQANGIPIEGWTHDPNDEALLDLLPVLDSLRFASDVRHILGIRGFSDLATRTTNSGRA
jgi:CTD nuclear envelope phosphatase 1